MYDGSGTLFALGFRVTKLDASGAPIPGTTSCYMSSSLVTVSTGLDYTKPNIVTQENGAGQVCVSYAAPASLSGAHIASMQVCVPDPIILQFLLGGNILLDVNNVEVGYQAPAIGSTPNPNGVSLELYTRAVQDGAFANQYPYFWWVFPRCTSFTLSADTKLEAANAGIPEFAADAQQNPNWGAGPDGLWQWDSSRVWQYARVSTIPNLSQGYANVPVPPTVTSVTVTPATSHVALDAEAQLLAKAHMSDSTVRDVTSIAAWTSSNPASIVVGSGGLAQGVSAGSATITATFGTMPGTAAVISP
jgi:hypothetical protein